MVTTPDPSPKFHSHCWMKPWGVEERSVNCTESPAQPGEEWLKEATGLPRTSTDLMVSFWHPSVLLTVSFTLKVPADANR